MTFPAFPASSTASMTSREIAELTGKRHDHVMRDIRNMIDRLENFNENNHDPDLGSAQTPTWHCDTEHYIDPNGRAREMYRLDKDTTHCLIAGYDPVPRMRIIKRLAQLESGRATQIAISPIAEQEQTALTVLQSRISAATILQVPAHIGQQEAVKAVHAAIGVDYSPLLIAAPAQQQVADEDEMLEPTELAERLGFKNARVLNRALRDAGLQIKANGEWVPTEKGASLCVRHAWTAGSKSGYNLKWRVASVRGLVAGEHQQ